MRFDPIGQVRAAGRKGVGAPYCAYVAAALLAALGRCAYAAPGDLAGAFAQLGAGRVESRSVSLADLGVRDPVVLRAPDATQELYLPVPAGLPISNATLQLDANYLRGSIEAHGMNPDDLPTGDASSMSFGSEDGETGDGEAEERTWKVWRDIWGSGQGIGVIDERRPVRDLVAQLKAEYDEAAKGLLSRLG